MYYVHKTSEREIGSKQSPLDQEQSTNTKHTGTEVTQLFLWLIS